MALSTVAAPRPHIRLRNAAYLDNVPPLAEGHAILLPVDRTRKSDSFCNQDGFSVSARVRKGRLRARCQDSAVSFVCERFAMVAVLDGYQKDGDFYSSNVSRRLVELCRERADEIPLNPDARALLIDSASAVSNESLDGGTTAAVALLLRSRVYSIAGIGDCAAYELECASARRMLDYARVLDPVSLSIGVPFVRTVGSFTMEPADYAGVRNKLISAINAAKIDAAQVETAEGRLERGSRLALMSDGVYKNFTFSVDCGGSVADVSCNADLAEMLRGVVGVRRATYRVLSEAESRGAGSSIVYHVKSRKVLMPSGDDMAIAMVSCD